MSAVLLALAGGYGVYLLYTAFTLGWSGLAPGPGGARPAARARARVTGWLAQAGVRDARISELAAVMAILAVVGGAAAFALFGGIAPALVTGAFTATIPIASWRHRRDQRLNRARDAWPRMLEEVRLQTGSLGRSVPQALLDVDRRGPEELRPAFVAAEREWLISTDFARTCAVLKSGLADPTADATCETLLVAHEVGGTDLDRRLASLVEDRIQDLNGRKDARAKQAGVRFARRFVLAVPVGMALAGLSIGTGRAAYGTTGGQAAVGAGILSVIACWLWAGRLLRLPEEERVFHR